MIIIRLLVHRTFFENIFSTFPHTRRFGVSARLALERELLFCPAAAAAARARAKRGSEDLEKKKNVSDRARKKESKEKEDEEVKPSVSKTTGILSLAGS